MPGGDSLSTEDVLVVQDIEPVLQEMDRIVAAVDVRPRQVLIEAVLLTVQLDDEHRMGVNFAILSGKTSLLVAGNGAIVNSAAGFPPSTLVNAAGKVQGGFADNAHGLKYGVIRGDLTGFVRLLETVGHTTIVASPKVLALNKQRAEIIVGSRLGYRTLTATETSTVENVEFLDLGTQLRMRPFIQPDGCIRMELHPERSSGRINPDTQLPEEDTSSVTTNLTIPSGTTIVIGGLIEEQQQRTTQQIPLLGSLPYVGSLFRDETTSVQRHELIVLITPRLVDDEEALAEALTELESFGARQLSLRDSFPHVTRVALAQKYLERACHCRDQGDLTKALELAELAVHFDPLNEAAVELRDELRSAAPAEVTRPSAPGPASQPSVPAPPPRLPKRRFWSKRG